MLGFARQLRTPIKAAANITPRAGDWYCQTLDSFVFWLFRQLQRPETEYRRMCMNLYEEYAPLVSKAPIASGLSVQSWLPGALHGIFTSLPAAGAAAGGARASKSKGVVAMDVDQDGDEDGDKQWPDHVTDWSDALVFTFEGADLKQYGALAASPIEYVCLV